MTPLPPIAPISDDARFPPRTNYHDRLLLFLNTMHMPRLPLGRPPRLWSGATPPVAGYAEGHDEEADRGVARPCAACEGLTHPSFIYSKCDFSAIDYVHKVDVGFFGEATVTFYDRTKFIEGCHLYIFNSYHRVGISYIYCGKSYLFTYALLMLIVRNWDVIEDLCFLT